MVLPSGSTLWRIHRTELGPFWFGPGEDNPPAYRFDAPDGDYGVCYLAKEPAGAFAESFLRDPTSAGKNQERILPASLLEARTCSAVLVKREVRVAALLGPGLSWHGVTAQVSSTPLYEHTREISLRIHGDDERWDGIVYRCRHDDDELAYALFERARDAVGRHPKLSLPCLTLGRLLETKYAFVIDRDR